MDGSLLSDDEYVKQKKAIRDEFEMVEKQLKTVLQQGLNWIDDCENFFKFTQQLATKFLNANTSIEDKKALLLLVCSNISIKDQQLAIEYKEPYKTLMEFPLAGVPENTKFEREKVLVQAEKPEIVEYWLGRRDSNPRVTGSEPVALPLGYSPMDRPIISVPPWRETILLQWKFRKKPG